MAHNTTSTNNYKRVLESFSSEELAQISQLKRFFEWIQGDADFRDHVDAGTFSHEERERLKKIGVMFDVNEVALLWEAPDTIQELVDFRSGMCEVNLTDETVEVLKAYPLLELWLRFGTRRTTIYRELRKTIFRIPKNSKFDAWRLRHIAAVRSELGFFGHFIDHPILAFELGDGCSVGCWFCAFATRKLTENFDYEEHKDFFRQIANQCVKLFGRDQASMALLYYGTEPHDNPHYLDCMEDYAEITGHPVCTATSVVNDPKWMRELIAFYRRGPHPWPRLSVLSKNMLFKIHDLYSPDELRDVELLMQMRDHPRQKVTGGRILEEHEGLRNREAGHYFDEIVPQGSIACVTGFLINMVHQTIQLVSPCYTNAKWPYGYRVFDTSSFDDADDFLHVMEQMIDRNTPDVPFSNMPVSFRDDLVYRQTDEGFDLASPNQIHHFRGKEIYGLLGSVIAEGGVTYDELYDVMLSKHGINPMFVVAVVKKLFDNGFLNDVDLAKYSQ